MTKDWELKLGEALERHLGKAVADWLVNLRCQDEIGNDHADAATLHLFKAGAEWERGEAARVCDRWGEVLGEGGGIAQQCAAEIRGDGDQPPPDTGWRDRPPTTEEVEAHPDEWVFDDGDEASVCFLKEQGIPDVKDVRWRPVTRELLPAPWPEVSDIPVDQITPTLGGS